MSSSGPALSVQDALHSFYVYRKLEERCHKMWDKQPYGYIHLANLAGEPQD